MTKVSIHTYYQTALDLHKSGKIKEARKLYQEILQLKPDHLESLFMLGQSWFQEHQFEKALACYDQGLRLQKSHGDIQLQKGKTLIKLGRLEEARTLFEILVKGNSNNPQVLFHAARNLKEMGDFGAAIQLYRRVMQLNPAHMQALNNLANIYQQVYDFENSLNCYDQLIALDPGFSMAYCNKAGLLQKWGKLDEAEDFYQKTLQLEKSNAVAKYNLGVINNRRFQPEKALEWIMASIKDSPNNHKYISTYASTLYNLGKRNEGVSILQKLVDSEISSEDPYLKLAKIFLRDHEPDQVIRLLQPYVEKNPYCFEGMCLLGIAYDLEGDLLNAEKYLTKVDQHPEYALRAHLILQMVYSKMGRLDKYHEMMDRVTNLLHQFIQSDRQINEIPVYNLIYYPYDLDLIAKATRKYSQSLINSITPLRSQLNFNYPGRKERIRVGYISPYFQNHPAGTLIKGVLKHHDRTRFEVYGYAINCKKDELNSEVRPLLDHYRELGPMTSRDAASLINQDGIHILISLAGYNYGMNTEIPALRPAPIQVVCMDCHESMQTDFYDYMFKDEVVVTESNRPFFSESIAYLPPSHFFTTEMIPSDKKVSRSDYDLPSDAFIFGCLNHPRKINPQAIQAWSQILTSVPNAVIWLYQAGFDMYSKNILKSFETHGVDARQIRFCGKENTKDHVRRMELIDLFLDTPIYNGHTTCLEALWMSVPVLTLRGFSISSRLCSSFLEAIGMQEMICDNIRDYVTMAKKLASEKAFYQSIKDQFKGARANSAFFDPGSLTRNMEAAYLKMWENYQAGNPRSDFKIAANGGV